MRIANSARRLSAVFILAAATMQSSYAETEETGKSLKADDLPSYEKMLAAALKGNPEVRAAQAELDRARLRIAKEIRAFRDEWQAQLSALTAAEIAIRDAERLAALQDGAIAGKIVLEAKRLAESSRRQAALAQVKLNEMESMLPLLLGTAIVMDSAGKAHPDHADEGDPGHYDHQATAPGAKLLRERLKLLLEIAKLQHQAYTSGEVGFDAVASSQMDLLAARLELVNANEERIKIRHEMAQIARQIEDVTVRLFQANEATKVDVLKAKALRLRAEADLKGEQSAAKHGH